MKAKAETKSELMAEIAELRAKLEKLDKAFHGRKGDKPNRDADDRYDMSRFPEENPNPVMRVSASGELLYANRPAIDMLEAMGWQKGGSLPEVLTRSIRGALEKKSDQEYELPCPRNRVFSFAVSATAGGGDINVYALDITRRKQAEEAMRQVRQDLNRAQEVGQIGSWRMDVRRNVLTWSEENHRIFGVPKGTPLTYETFLGIVHPGDRQYVDKKWQAALSGKPYDIEHRIIVDQQVKWVREKAYLEFDDEGQLLGGFGITQDITERKLVEEALRRSEERYRSLFEGMTEGFALHEIICDEKGVPCDYMFLEVNPAFERLTGLKRGDIIHKTVNQILPDEDPRWVKIYGEVALTGKSVHFENYSPVLKKHYEVFAYSPAPRRFGVLFMDITERKQAEEREGKELKETSFTNRILALFVVHDGDELFNRVLAVVQETMASKHGVFGYIAEPGHLYCPSLSKMLDECEIEGKCIHYPPEKWKGLWARAMTDKRSFYTNEASPVPPGHPIIHNNLAVPILFRGEAIGLLNLANKEGGYNEEDRKMVDGLAARMAPVLYAWIQHKLRDDERKRAEEALRKAKDELEVRVQARTEELAKSHQRLQQLASQLLQAQEKERKRVAVDLHDGLMSELAATKFLLEGKIMLLDKGNPIDPAELRRVADILAGAMKEARRLMNNLHPSVLDELGLIATIGWLCSEYQRAYPNITVQREIAVFEKDIAEGIKVVIYRVLQEALNNFARHGKGDRVEVSLSKSDGTFSLVIRDNGQGFDVEKVQKGLGLESMRERVELSDGEFQIESTTGQGTAIRANWSG